MSIQLIVFPQSYNGQHNVITSGVSNQVVADGQLFTTAGGAMVISPFYDPSGLAQIITTSGYWQRVKDSGLTSPTVSGGVVTLYDETTKWGSQILQTVVLTPGTQYDLVCNTSTTASGKIRLAVYDGVTFIGQQFTLARS